MLRRLARRGVLDRSKVIMLTARASEDAVLEALELGAADHVAKHVGKMLWRVQVRRGLVRVKSREVSATAVVGVEFTRDDIQVPRS